VRIAIICIAANLIISLALIFGFGFDHVGLAISTSISSWLNVILLWAALAKRDLFSFMKTTRVRAIKIFAASAIMSLAVYEFFALAEGHVSKLPALVLAVSLGGAIFFALVYATKAVDVKSYVGLIKGKISRRKS